MVSAGWWANDKPLFLGNAVQFGDRRRQSEPLSLTMSDRTRHKVEIGGSGSGKSTSASSQIRQDIAANRGISLYDAQDLVRQMLWLLIELALPGRLTEQAVRQLGHKVIVIEPANRQYGVPGFNPLAPRRGLTTFEIVDSLVELLIELWPEAASVGARMISITRNMLLVLAELRLTLAEAVLFLSDADVRNYLVHRSRSAQAIEFFLRHLGGLRPSEQKMWFESSRNKWEFASTPGIREMVGQSHSTFSFYDIHTNGQHILVNLSRDRLKLESRSVLGGMFLNAEHAAILGREDMPPAARILRPIYIDEAQTYWADETMNALLEAGRKYGAALAMFFQSTRQRPWDTNRGAVDNIMANCATKIAFACARQDAERMAAEMFNPSGTAVKFQQRNLFGLPTERPTFWSMGEEDQNLVAELMTQRPGEAYASCKMVTPRPFILNVPYVPDIKPPHPEKVAAFREHVARIYYRPIDQVNREITERHTRLRAEAEGFAAEHEER